MGVSDKIWYRPLNETLRTYANFYFEYNVKELYWFIKKIKLSDVKIRLFIQFFFKKSRWLLGMDVKNYIWNENNVKFGNKKSQLSAREERKKRSVWPCRVALVNRTSGWWNEVTMIMHIRIFAGMSIDLGISVRRAISEWKQLLRWRHVLSADAFRNGAICASK